LSAVACFDIFLTKRLRLEQIYRWRWKMSEQTTVTKETELTRAIGSSEFNFTRIDGWERIEEHIHVHKYLLDREKQAKVAWFDAVASWKESVFTPLFDAVGNDDVRGAFPGQKLGDLYLEVSDHWHYLKQSRPSASPATAAASYASRYGNRVASFIRKAGYALIGGGANHRWASSHEIQRRIDDLKGESELLQGNWY
jgi:hypothetical protein